MPDSSSSKWSADGPISSPDLAVFAVCAGILATFTLGYHYGLVNHLELLPPVLRALDPAYCPGDFAVDAGSAYSHRFFFTQLCALLARILPLPAVLLLLTLAQNIGVALVTGFAARDLHGCGTPAPLVAIALVLAVESIQLGGAAFLRQPYALPGILALPLALLALWRGIRLQPAAALACALPATLLHPLIGLEIGGLALAVCGASALLGPDMPSARRRRIAGMSLLALAALGLFMGLAWGPAQCRNFLSTREFLDIYARLRAPHHILPSTFPPADYLAAGALLLAAALSWREWRRSPAADHRWNRGLWIGTGLVLALLVGGWLFVERLPSRFWAALQTFRLVLVLKWFGLLLIAGTVGRAWTSRERGARLAGTLLFLPVGLLQPFGALWALGIDSIRRRLPAALGPWLGATGVAGLALLMGLPPSMRTARSFREAFTLLAIAGLLALFHFIPRRIPRWLLAGLCTAALTALIIANRNHRLPVLGRPLALCAPVFTLADADEPGDAVARFCRRALPPDALVLTPPNLGRFRLVAERAIVVDFKFAMPTDAAWVEWRRRMTACYGPVTERGFAAAWQMDRQYRLITDSHLAGLAAAYGVTHAVLHAETPTQLPVLYADPSFQLVRLPPPP